MTGPSLTSIRVLCGVASLLLLTSGAAADRPPHGLRVEAIQATMPDDAPAWLAPAIVEALSHDLSGVRGIAVSHEEPARFVVRGGVQSVNGAIRVQLVLLDEGRQVGQLRVTGTVEQLFALQDALGEQARALVERSLRRRADDVAPEPREVMIRYLDLVTVNEPDPRPTFLPAPPTSLDAARIRRGHVFDVPTDWWGRGGWYGWPGSCRWLW